MIKSRDKLLAFSNKLLDMGKRNKLLNFKESKTSTLNFIKPDADDIFRMLINGNKLEVAYRGKKEDAEVITGEDEEKVYKALKKGQLLSSNNDYETKRALYRLRSKARLAIEEQGVNILYIAFGFLEWKENNGDIYKSPILLVPVKVTIDSINAPYKITEFEDEILLNQTLLYKMKNTFNVILPEYDEDKHKGLSDYLNEVTSIVNDKGWTISSEVVMGLFSFNKLNMYMDLIVNQDLVLSNPIIKSICGESSCLEGFSNDDFNGELDSKLSVNKTFCVADADSSQLDAILQMKKGRSFVLQGPPGTGKSQTITNLIAESLAENKKVLFVSEKQAALNVVFRNLDRAGLEDFCLELHSHKANKKDVIAELHQTLTTQKTNVNSVVYDELNTLSDNIRELNDYVGALHKNIDILAKSPYQVFSEYVAYKNYPVIDCNLSDIATIGNKELTAYKKLIDEYKSYNNIIGYDYRENCYYGYTGGDNSLKKQNEIKKLYERFTQLIDDYISSEREIVELLGLNRSNSVNSSQKLIEVLDIISKIKVINREWLDRDFYRETVDTLKHLKEELSYYNNKATELAKVFDLEILEHDFTQINTRFRSKYTSIMRIFNSEYKSDCNLIKSYLIKGKKINHKEIQLYVYKIKKMQDINKYLEQNYNTLNRQLGSYYKGKETDCNLIEEQLASLDRLRAITNISDKLVDIITSDNSIKGKYSDDINKLKAQLGSILDIIEIINVDYNKSIFNINEISYDKLYNKFNQIIDNIGRFSDWINFSLILEQLEKSNLIDFINKAIDMAIPIDQYEGVLSRKFYYLWIDEILRSDRILGRFTREKHEAVIMSFKQKDTLGFKIAQARIRELLSALRPDYNAVSGASEIGILLREAEKKRKQMTVRKLFEQIPRIITTLKPCLLMSPMSVSQYINPNSVEFDLIIFDEASQIFPEDALGAIYRGKQIIVVGDSEQLPPTNFFNASSTDSDYDIEKEEEEEDVNSFESILDICNSCLNRIKLKWHYRSKYEELIAFSNHKIYKNELVSFPSATKKLKDTGVEYIYLSDGVYDRSTSRTNKVEARYVAEMVFSHYDNYPDRTIGVVAFSEAQQEAIENEIVKLRKTRLEYERFFDEGKDEGFFVKNIESVQGDERDVIIFSIGYAKDSNGKLYMNFGPLSRDGGERRLNVAITRARINVKLVGSILPSDIDAEKSKLGVKLLKSYIEFARDGVQTLDREVRKALLEDDFAFENSIIETLNDNGYETDVKVGCSGYKIDIAVKHPEIPEVYVMGIECDGNTYRNTRTARDRDRLRAGVLERLNWKLYRIWSTDWIKREDSERERLLDAVKRAVINYNDYCKGQIIPLNKNNLNLEKAIEPKAEESFKEYIDIKVADYIKKSRSAENNYKAVMDAIMENESPVHIDSVLKKIMPLFNREKMSSYVKDQFKILYKGWKPSNVVYKEHYFILTNKPIEFRIPSKGDTPRPIEMIHKDELSDGIIRLIDKNISILQDGLIKDISKTLGYNRVTENISVAINNAINLLIEKNRIKREGDMLIKI